MASESVNYLKFLISGDSSQLLSEVEKARRGVTGFSDDIGNGLGGLFGKLRGTEEGLNRVGMSAKAMSAAMRGVPAQISDIVVSLQGGMSPMTVFFQQGLQLRDMFNGFGAAGKALGTTLLGMVNPLTVAGAAAAALGVAYYQGSKEADAFIRSIALTGNASGVTTSQLHQYAREIDAVVGTQAQAAAGLADFVAAGVRGNDELRRYTQTAIEWEKFTGQAIDKTASQFAALQKDPLAAVVKLNEGTNFLTVSVYEQIKALEEQGHKANASKVAMDALDSAMRERAKTIEESLGYIERGWNAIKGAAAQAWDAMLNVGRPATIYDQINAKQAELDRKLTEPLAVDNAAMRASREIAIERLRNEIWLLYEKADAEKVAAMATEESARITGARLAFDQKYAKALEGEVTLEAKLAAVRREAAAANMSEAQTKAALAWVTEEHNKANRGSAAAAKQLSSAYSGLLSGIAEKADALKLEIAAGAKASDADKLRIKFQLDLQSSLKGLTAVQRAEIENRLKNLKRLEEEKEALKAAAKALEEERKYRQEWWAAQAKTVDELEASNKALREEIELIGLGAAGQSLILRQREEAIILVKEQQLAEMQQAENARQHMNQTRINLEQEIALRREGLALTDQKIARTATAQAAEANVQEWERAFGQTQQSLTDALMQGGKSGADYIKGLFRSMVLRPIIQAVVAPMAGTALSMLGLPSTAAAASSAGGLMGGASNASAAYNLISGGLNAAGSAGMALSTKGTELAIKYLGDAAGTLVNDFALGMMSNTGLSAAADAVMAGGAQMAGVLAGAAMNGFLGYGISKTLSGGYSAGNWVNTAAGIASAIPGIGPIAGVVGGLVNRAFGRKLKDSGIEGTFGGDAGFAGNSYQFYKGGWFRSDKTVRGDLDEELRAGLADQFNAMRFSAASMADVLGLGTAAIDGFTASIKLSFQGLSEEDIQKALAAEFDTVAESMASLTLGTTDYTRAGETAVQTIARLSGSLTAANSVFDQLGMTLYASSLAGGDMASSLLDLFGGADGFVSATGAYFQNFYSADEQRAALERQLNTALTNVHLQLPDISASNAREQYRALAEAQDLTTESGRKAWATLMQLQGSFAQLAQSADDVAQAAVELAANLRSGLIGLEGRFGNADTVRAYQARDAAQSIQGLLSGVGIGKDLGVLTQTLLSATSADVESYFRQIWAVLPTDEARQKLVGVAGSMLDLAAAAEAAAQAVASERAGLEQRWLQAIGDTAELRRRELIALDPSNRALLEMIYGLEDAKASMANLTAAVQSAAQQAAQAWQGWGTAAGLGAQYLGDTSGLEARRAILNAQIGATHDPAERLAKLQELIGIEQSIGQAQQASRKVELDAINLRQQSLQKEIASAQQLLSAAQSLSDYVAKLQTSEASGLSDYDRLRALGGQYGALLGQARAGDVDAMSKLQGVSGDYMGLARQLAASGADYSVFAGRMAAEMQAVAAVGQASASSSLDYYQRQIEQLTQQSELLSAQVELSDGTKSLIAKSMLDQAEAWDRENTLSLTLQQLQQRATDSLALMPDGIARALRPALDANASYIANSVGWSVSSAIGALAGMLGGGVPGFASGGLHTGGLRIVGERGWELEATGPSRIWNQQQLAGALSGGNVGSSNAEVVAQLRELNRRIERLESHAARTADSTDGLYDITDNKSEGGNADRVELMNTQALAQAIAQAIKEAV